MAKLIKEEFEETKALLDPEIDTFFVDFLRDAPARTGNDGLITMEMARIGKGI